MTFSRCRRPWCQPCGSASAHPPADFGGKTLVEVGIIGAFRGLAHPLIEAASVIADQDAPALRLDAVENDRRRRGSRGRALLEKAPGTLGRDSLNVGV